MINNNILIYKAPDSVDSEVTPTFLRVLAGAAVSVYRVQSVSVRPGSAGNRIALSHVCPLTCDN